MSAVRTVRVGYAAIRLYGVREIRSITSEGAAQACTREPQSVLRPWVRTDELFVQALLAGVDLRIIVGIYNSVAIFLHGLDHLITGFLQRVLHLERRGALLGIAEHVEGELVALAAHHVQNLIELIDVCIIEGIDEDDPVVVLVVFELHGKTKGAQLAPGVFTVDRIAGAIAPD